MSAAYYPQVQKIYVAYYGRPADPAGLQYWAGQLAANGGNLTSIINAFGNSAESTALYAGASDSAKVTAIYQQLFNRAPDSAGLAFYTAELTAGRMTAASIALNVANGAQGTDATYLANKVTVGTAFTDSLTVDNAAAVAYTGTTAITAARSLITGVTTSAATTNVASTITSIKSGGGAAAGQTFTLTANEDNLMGTAGNDTFNATTRTLTNDDKITDASSTDRDVLNISAPGALDTALDITNVETINIDWQRLSNASFALDNVSGADLVSLTSSRSAFTGNASFTAVGSNNISVGAGVDGTLTVAAPEDATISATVADVINVTGGDGTLTINAGVASTVSVAGTLDEVTLIALSADDITLDGGYDEASLVVGVDTSVSFSGASDSIITVTSDSDITLTVESASTYEELNAGGSGTVDLVFENENDLDGLVITTNGSVTLLSAASADLDMVQADEIIFASNETASLELADGQVLTFAGTYNAGDYTLRPGDDLDNSSNDLSVNLTQSVGPMVFDSSATADFETVTINIELDDDFDTDAALTIDRINGTGGSTDITFLSTDADADILVSSLQAASVDAGGVVGRFSFTQGAAATGGIVVIGAEGGGTATFNNTSADVEFTADSDGDHMLTLSTTSGAAYINIMGNGDNTATFSNEGNGFNVDVTFGDGDNRLSFTGGTGDITFSFGSGDDVLDFAGTAAYAVDGSFGGGDDIAYFSAAAANATGAAWTLDFGAGSDTLHFQTGSANFTSADLDFDGLETIVIASAGVIHLDSDVLHQKSYMLMTDGGDGATATATVYLEVDTGAVAFDGSDLDINATIGTLFMGLDVRVVNGGANTLLTLSEGDDNLQASAGDDTISGGAGADVMSGDSGADTFVFVDGDSNPDNINQSAATAYFDTISDFATAQGDVIDLGAAGSLTNYEEYNNESAMSGFGDARSVADAQSDADDDIIYLFIGDTTDGWLFADYDDDGTVDLAVKLTGLGTLAEFSGADLV